MHKVRGDNIYENFVSLQNDKVFSFNYGFEGLYEIRVFKLQWNSQTELETCAWREFIE